MTIIEDSERKLRAIAAANKRLSDSYEDKDSLREIIDETVRENLFNVAEKNIEHELQIEDVLLKKDHFSLIALIINELTVNSIKHAFHNTELPKISIRGVQKGNEFILNYSDNGNYKQGSDHSEGSDLIIGLADQMAGKIKVDVSKGYTFTLSIPTNEE